MPSAKNASKSVSKSVAKSVSKSAGTPKITIKPAKATKQAKEEEEVFEDDHDDMGSSFLQFWFVQIISIDSDNSLAHRFL